MPCPLKMQCTKEARDPVNPVDDDNNNNNDAKQTYVRTRCSMLKTVDVLQQVNLVLSLQTLTVVTCSGTARTGL